MRSPPAVLLVGGGAAYALIAASTRPFTLPADVLTGLATADRAQLSERAQLSLRVRATTGMILVVLVS